MARAQNPNLEILMLAVDQLGPLADELVFLGGCATGLLMTDVAAPPIRITRDVDAVVQVVSLVEYYRIGEKLRARGFKEDSSEGAPVCRWVSKNIILDIMPTDKAILGFGNNWYDAAANSATIITLPSSKKIRMVSAPYFLITKLEAFDDRGGGDYAISHDMEDIVAVLDGRPELLDEVIQAEPELIRALAKRFKKLLQDNKFVYAVSGHMPTDVTSQARVPNIMKILNALAKVHEGD